MMQDTSDQKKVFLRLPRDEQIQMLFDMVEYVRSELANDKKQHIDFSGDLKYVKGELQGLGRRKETLTTSQKFSALMDKRLMAWIWFRDKVLSGTLQYVFTIIVVGMLYLVFGGKLP